MITSQDIPILQNKEQQEAIVFLQQQHQQWLQNEVTKQAIGRLRKFRANLSNKISNASTKPEITDANIRHLAVALENTDVLINFLTDSETFVNKVSEK